MSITVSVVKCSELREACGNVLGLARDVGSVASLMLHIHSPFRQKINKKQKQTKTNKRTKKKKKTKRHDARPPPVS